MKNKVLKGNLNCCYMQKKTCIINPKTMNRNLSNYLYFEEEVWRAKNHNILEICMFSIEVHSVSQFIVWSADVMSNIS